MDCAAGDAECEGAGRRGDANWRAGSSDRPTARSGIGPILAGGSGAADDRPGEAGKRSYGGLQLFRAGNEGPDVGPPAENDQPGAKPGDAPDPQDGQVELPGNWDANG